MTTATAGAATGAATGATTGSITPALWLRIVTASADVDRVVAAVPAGAQLGAGGTAQLHKAVRDALDGLRTELLAALPERTAYEAIFPLVLYFDERVTARLDERDAAAWPLLQRELYDVETGGDLFYDLADKRLADPTAAPVTLSTLLYCLRNGFLGKAADDPAEATTTERRLASAIELPALAPAAVPATARITATPHSPRLYYALSALAAAGVAAVVVLGT